MRPQGLSGRAIAASGTFEIICRLPCLGETEATRGYVCQTRPGSGRAFLGSEMALCGERCSSLQQLLLIDLVEGGGLSVLTMSAFVEKIKNAMNKRTKQRYGGRKIQW